MLEQSAPLVDELPEVLAVSPEGLRALELVDDAHPRPPSFLDRGLLPPAWLAPALDAFAARPSP
jgi:hypothetical protein